jgi:predicted HAD superfamily Cof-like phosphohydrolase
MKEQELISKWLTLAGVESPNEPQFPESKNLQLALSLVLEELVEAAESASYEDAIEFFSKSINFLQKANLKLQNSEDKKEEGDLIELRDACADMRVVMGNLIHFAGIKDQFDKDFEDVMDSNFSKFCTSEQEAIDSVAAYASGTHPNKMGDKIACFYEKVGEYWIVKVSDTKKVMKSINFKDVEFK